MVNILGFAPFLETKEFQEMNVGVALDEGQASTGEEFSVYYGERLSWCKDSLSIRFW
jgi:aminoacylase